ncbi:hypothetical protein MTX78_16180 [Hymenobacter tibetensis]|uniref:Uncharacterized protein n=1 Tax=Hymenobacter tibetensis TaxID=497967 RepID=A0ABY4CW03_9BACT|nr:hypothetical protein [Hymenobacter tibetensis]UOG73659.1 hypothetical protein MTX78_16180 [Hymenobacter tibetensis]
MRTLYLLLAALAAPSFCFAQRDFTPGTYELLDGTKGEGNLKYTSGSGAELLVKTTGKKHVAFAPEKVKSFKAADKFFVPIHDFVLDSGMPMSMKYRIKHDFAELLDSGRVELLSYTLLTSTRKPGQMSMPGDTFYGGLALIRRRGEQPTSIPLGPKKARPVIVSFIKDRPDLVARLNKEPYTPETIRSIVQAYNLGQK